MKSSYGLSSHAYISIVPHFLDAKCAQAGRKGLQSYTKRVTYAVDDHGDQILKVENGQNSKCAEDDAEQAEESCKKQKPGNGSLTNGDANLGAQSTMNFI